MLHTNQSNKWKRVKTFIILPILGVFIWSFNIKKETRYIYTKSEIFSEKENSTSFKDSTKILTEFSIKKPLEEVIKPALCIRIDKRRA